MHLIGLKTKSGESLPMLLVLEKEVNKITKECWGCPFISVGKEPDPLSATPQIYQQVCQFTGFRKFSLVLCTRCTKMLKNVGLNGLSSTFEFIHSKDGEISPIAPEAIDIYIKHTSNDLHIRCYKLQKVD